MNFVDTTLIKLTDPATRGVVFDQDTLAQMAAAAYDAAALSIAGPYAAVFDEIGFGLSIAPLGSVEGTLRNEAGMPTANVQLQVGGMGPFLPARVDALWHGSIVAQTVPVDSRITGVGAQFATADIDAGIVKSAGSLPTDPAALEAARRAAVMAGLKAAMKQPDLLTDDAFDAWLAQLGVASVGELVVDQRGGALPGVVQVRMSAPPAAGRATPRSLPVVVAILIRDAGFSVAELLMESKMLREQLVARGVDIVRNPSLPARHPFLVLWAVPASSFDDAGWPGTGASAAALRQSRRQQASTWLGAEGIAIAAVDTA